MIRRQKTMRFMGGYYAFPGGKVDPADATAEALARCRGLAPATATRLVPAIDGVDPLAFWISAARELLEEAGVLLAVAEDGGAIDVREPDVAARVERMRRDLLADAAPFASLLAAEAGISTSLPPLSLALHHAAVEPDPRNRALLLAPMPPDRMRPRYEEASEGWWKRSSRGVSSASVEVRCPWRIRRRARSVTLRFESLDALWARSGRPHKSTGILDASRLRRWAAAASA